MAKIIDEFIIKVKLDTSEYEAGQKKLEKMTQKTKEKAVEAGNSFGDAVAAGASKASGKLGILGSMLGKGGMIGVAVGSLIYAGKVLDDKLFAIARGVRQVGIDSKNFNTAAGNLRNLQNASEMAGGSIEDADKTVGGLAQSLFNLKFNGEVSDSLIMLSRLGVQFQDSYGRARDFNAVMLDTAAAIDKAKSAGRMNDSEASFFAEQAGFTGGMRQLVTSGKANVQMELARQAARTQITSGTLGGATDWVRASTSFGQSIVSEAGLKGVNALGEKRAESDMALEEAGKDAIEWMSDLGDTMSQLADDAEKAGKNLHDYIAPWVSKLASMSGMQFVPNGNDYTASIAESAKKYGIPNEVLTGLIRTESGFNPNAINPSGAKGIAQLMPETGKMLGVTPGADAAADIDASARYLSMLKSAGEKAGFKGDMAMAYAVDAYHSGMGNLATGKNLGPESTAYAGKVFAGTSYANTDRPWMKGSGGGTINIDEINIHTQATDANGISDTIGTSLKNNKLLTAHAEGGLQ